jgi:hypothetical protein
MGPIRRSAKLYSISIIDRGSYDISDIDEDLVESANFRVRGYVDEKRPEGLYYVFKNGPCALY